MYDDLAVTVFVIICFCATVVTIWNFVKVVREMRRPTEERNDKIEELERKLASDKAVLDVLEKESKLTLRGQLLIIEHLTTGNHTDQLDALMDEMQDYLINK